MEDNIDQQQVESLLFTPQNYNSDPSGDIPPIAGTGDFFRQFNNESKKLWHLMGPAIFTSVCRYSLGAVTQLFAGQVSTLALAAVAVENSVIAGFSLGIMMGMGSALETLCGQAFGAGQLDMLGIYMQRSWVILNTTGLVLTFVYIFAGTLLRLIGQTPEISEAAGNFAVWMIPQLFAYAMNFPITKFLQSQSKVAVMAVVAASALLLNTFFSWLLILKLRWGLAGAAVALNGSWWFIVVAQLVYIFSGTCGRAWCGFSWMAFQNLWGFVKLSLASAVMLCSAETSAAKNPFTFSMYGLKPRHTFVPPTADAGSLSATGGRYIDPPPPAAYEVDFDFLVFRSSAFFPVPERYRTRSSRASKESSDSCWSEDGVVLSESGVALVVNLDGGAWGLEEAEARGKGLGSWRE